MGYSALGGIAINEHKYPNTDAPSAFSITFFINLNIEFFRGCGVDYFVKFWILTNPA